MQEQTKEPSLFATIDSAGNDFDIDFSKELNDKIKENPNFKAQIRYNKEPFGSLIFTNFTAFDFNLFMCFCFVAKDKRNLSIKLSFNDLEFLIGKESKSGKRQKIDKNSARLFKSFDEFCEKAAKVIIKKVDNDGNTYTHLFDSIKIYKERKIIIIRFNTLMVKALNDFTRYFTEFELQKYCELKSKYSKHLCIVLMNDLYQANKEQIIKKSREELIEYLGLKDKKSYKDENNFKKYVLDIVCEDLNKFFGNFKIERIYGNGKSNRKVIAYNFIYKK